MKNITASLFFLFFCACNNENIVDKTPTQPKIITPKVGECNVQGFLVFNKSSTEEDVLSYLHKKSLKYDTSISEVIDKKWHGQCQVEYCVCSRAKIIVAYNVPLENYSFSTVVFTTFQNRLTLIEIVEVPGDLQSIWFLRNAYEEKYGRPDTSTLAGTFYTYWRNSKDTIFATLTRTFTDENHVVKGPFENFKITFPSTIDKCCNDRISRKNAEERTRDSLENKRISDQI